MSFGMGSAVMFRVAEMLRPRFSLLPDPPSFPHFELVVPSAALLRQGSGSGGSDQAPLISPWYGY